MCLFVREIRKHLFANNHAFALPNILIILIDRLFFNFVQKYKVYNEYTFDSTYNNIYKYHRIAQLIIHQRVPPKSRPLCRNWPH